MKKLAGTQLQGPALAVASFVTTVSVLMLFIVLGAMLSTGQAVVKQATKNLEGKLK